MNLQAGNVIVMWDGHYFGSYEDLETAKNDVIKRVSDKEQSFTYPYDLYCAEFLEVSPNQEIKDGILSISWGTNKDQDGDRYSFGYRVIDHGYLLKEIK